MIEVKNELAKYKTVFSNSNFSFCADNDKSKGGNNNGFRLHEILEAALAFCMNMWIRMYADNNGIKINNVLTQVKVNREIPDETLFKYKINLDENLSGEQKEKLYYTAETCPIRKTLSKKYHLKG